LPAPELSFAAEPATTQRGAIKKLKEAISGHVRRAANERTHAKFLDDAGYTGELKGFSDITLAYRHRDTQGLLMPLSLKRRPHVNPRKRR